MSSAAAFQDLLERTESLDSTAFEAFYAKIVEIRERKNRSNLESKEAELLQKLARRMPKAERERMGFLMEKMDSAAFSAAEKAELDRLIETFEKFDFDYAKALVELAQLRKMTIPQTLDHFKLRHPKHG